MNEEKPKFSFIGGLIGVLSFTAILMFLCLAVGYFFKMPMTVQDITVNNIFWWMFGGLEFYVQGVKHGRQQQQAGHEDNSRE